MQEILGNFLKLHFYSYAKIFFDLLIPNYIIFKSLTTYFVRAPRSELARV